jgi:hypothetical protein
MERGRGVGVHHSEQEFSDKPIDIETLARVYQHVGICCASVTGNKINYSKVISLVAWSKPHGR